MLLFGTVEAYLLQGADIGGGQSQIRVVGGKRRSPVHVAIRADQAHVHTEKGLEHRPGEHFVRRALSHHPPFEADNAGGVVGHHAKVVADHDLGEALRGAEVFKKLAEKAATFKVHTGGRFVEHKEFGLLLKGEGKEHPLHLATGKRAHAAFQDVGSMHHFQKVRGFLAGAARKAQPERALLYAHSEEFRYGEGHASVEAQLLRHVADAQALAAAKFDAAAVIHFAEQSVEQGGLASAVRADEHSPASAWDGGVHIVEYVQTASRNAYVVEHDGGSVIEFQEPAPECADSSA